MTFESLRRNPYESGGACEGGVAFVEHGGEGLEDVRDFRGDLQSHGDVGGGDRGGEPGCVVKQHFVAAGLDQERRKAAEIREQRADPPVGRVGRVGIVGDAEAQPLGVAALAERLAGTWVCMRVGRRAAGSERVVGHTGGGRECEVHCAIAQAPVELSRAQVVEATDRSPPSLNAATTSVRSFGPTAAGTSTRTRPRRVSRERRDISATSAPTSAV